MQYIKYPQQPRRIKNERKIAESNQTPQKATFDSLDRPHRRQCPDVRKSKERVAL